MEFHDLGQQCAFSSCSQLDFLPFTCPHCGLVFCKEHYLPDFHNCTSIDCERESSQSIRTAISYFKCSNSDCTEKSAVPLLCPICQHHFCLLHRHHGCLDKPPSEEQLKRWNTPREQFTAAKSEVDRQVSSKLSEQVKKSSATAIKVQLMRLKGRAKGPSNVPVVERSYFLVFTPLQCCGQTVAAYVGKNWTLGRVIDSLADTCKVPNRNNDSTAPKLRLFHHVTGKIVGPITKTIQNLFEEGCLFDGASLVLEYIPGDNVQNDCLVNTTLYKQ